MNHPLLSIAIFVLASLIWGILIAATLLCIFYRRRVTPKRPLFSELKEGMDALDSTHRETLHHRKNRDAAERRLSRNNEDRVCYQFMGATGHEEE
jgi:hypothetical protein